MAGVLAGGLLRKDTKA